MKIGIFSDVHGDFEALLRVWNDFLERDLANGLIFNAGDTVTYGLHPEECIQFMRAHSNIVSVRGNYDKHVGAFLKRSDHYKEKWKISRPEKYQALVRDSKIVSDESRSWLSDLPEELTFSLDGKRIVLTHYAPGIKEGLGTWTSKARLAEIARNAHANIVVSGHTHTPFVRTAEGVLFVNPGSVGRSWCGQPQYAILTLESGHSPLAELKQL